MPRWRHLRWWPAAFAASLLSFLCLWLPAFFESAGAVGCTGYGPLPSGLAKSWATLRDIWLDFRQQFASSYGGYLALNALPMVSILVSWAVAAWSKRWPGTVMGLLAALVVAVVTLHWAFMAFSYLLDCGGAEAGLPWVAWCFLMTAGFGSAVALLLVGVRVRRAAGR
ncbi:hypothetical protein [Nonomuraea sp. NPDC005650]|uniref:hypothetical protein n=1 Tax=Nonomuraea sp. NPDC005650 TaxID=3157045 RepID=UPI0033B29956